MWLKVSRSGFGIFEVRGFGLGVRGLGFGVFKVRRFRGFVLGVQGLGFKVFEDQGFGFGVSRFEVSGLVFPCSMFGVSY